MAVDIALRNTNDQPERTGAWITLTWKNYRLRVLRRPFQALSPLQVKSLEMVGAKGLEPLTSWV